MNKNALNFDFYRTLDLLMIGLEKLLSLVLKIME